MPKPFLGGSRSGLAKRFFLLAATLLASCGFTLGQSLPPPAPAPTGEQKEQLTERDRLAQQVDRLQAAGKLDEAVAAAERMLAIEREVLGDLNDDVAGTLMQIGDLHRDREGWDAATTAYEEALRIRTKLRGTRHWKTVNVALTLHEAELRRRLNREQREVLKEADRLERIVIAPTQGKGRHKESLRFAERCLELRREILKEPHRDVARSILNLGVELHDRRDFAGAQRRYEEGLAMWRSLYDGPHPVVALILYNTGGALLDREDLRGAQARLGEALAMQRAAYNGPHREIADSLDSLAVVLLKQKQFDGAIRRFEEALAIRRALHNGPSHDVANNLSNLGMVLRDQGNLGGAQARFEEALAMERTLHNNPHHDVANILDHLAGVLDTQGDLDGARRRFEEALAIWRGLSDGPQEDVARCLARSASVYHQLGHLARARRQFEQAIAMGRELHTGPDRNIAVMLTNLGAVLIEMGEFSEARRRHEEAMAMVRNLYDSPHRDTAMMLNNLGVAYWRNGENQEARQLLEEALKVYRALEIGPDLQVALTLIDLGGVLSDSGDHQSARKRDEEALAMMRDLKIGPHPYLALCLQNLGVTQHKLGELDKARQHLEEANTIRMSLPGQRVLTAESLDNLAIVLHEQGDIGRARQRNKEALALLLQLLQRELPSLSEREQFRLIDAVRHTLDLHLSLTVTDGRDPSTLDTVVFWRGLTAEAAATRRRVARNPRIASLAGHVRDLRGRVNRLYQAGTSAEQDDGHDRQARRLADELVGAEAELAGALDWRPEAPTREQVSQALAPDTALVDIIIYKYRLGREQHVSGQPQTKRRYAAFVTRPGRTTVRVELGPASSVDRRIADWRARLVSGDAGIEPAGRALAALVWEPIRPYLDGVRTVVIAPDGDLHFVPWAALPGERPGSYLIESYAFATVGSARQLIASAGKRAAANGIGGLLALGDVDFDLAIDAAPARLAAEHAASSTAASTRGRPLIKGTRLSPLPGTGVEARLVADYFRKAHNSEPVVVLSEAGATKTAVHEALVGRRYLHLASHGFFAPEPFRSISDPTSAEDRIKRRLFEQMGRSDLVGWAPGLLSGLCFAGYNRPPADPISGDPDRSSVLMTAEEVESLDLAGCDLVVLSACDTGLGRVAGGEGVMGLQRAFHVAGARSVVASLWRVEDAATRELMESFYRHLWVDGLPRLEALRRAQLDVLEHPERVEARRKELAIQLAARDLGPPRPLPDGGRVATARGTPRSHPARWAGFVLSGAID